MRSRILIGMMVGAALVAALALKSCSKQDVDTTQAVTSKCAACDSLKADLLRRIEYKAYFDYVRVIDSLYQCTPSNNFYAVKGYECHPPTNFQPNPKYGDFLYEWGCKVNLDIFDKGNFSCTYYSPKYVGDSAYGLPDVCFYDVDPTFSATPKAIAGSFHGAGRYYDEDTKQWKYNGEEWSGCVQSHDTLSFHLNQQKYTISGKTYKLPYVQYRGVVSQDLSTVTWTIQYWLTQHPVINNLGVNPPPDYTVSNYVMKRYKR